MIYVKSKRRYEKQHKEYSENNILIFIDRTKKIRSCRDVACYVSTVQLPQNEQYQ